MLEEGKGRGREEVRARTTYTLGSCRECSSNIPWVKDSKMAKAPDSKIPVGGFHVFNIPSPYGSMLLILETSSPICSSLVPKPEDRGRDKAQRKSKNEKRERDGEGGWGQVKTNTNNSSPFESESEVRLDRGQDPSCEAGFLSLGEEQTCPHLAAPAEQGPMQTAVPTGWWAGQLSSGAKWGPH